jgi:hypothetical protein
MATIQIPEDLVPNIGPETGMDYHVIDVRLKDGRTLSRLVVQGGRFITGREIDFNGAGDLPFRSEDIANVRRSTWVFGRLWPFWPQARSRGTKSSRN